MPNKVTFMPLLDDLTEEARAIGAVNTVFIRLDSRGDRRYIGTNTDCVGIKETLLNNSHTVLDDARAQPALVIGAGGAARSAIYALWKWFKPSEIYIVNRLTSETIELIAGMLLSIPSIRLRHVESVEEAQRLKPPCVCVGTIPDDKPRGTGELLAWQICETFLKKRGQVKGVVLDMCYHPACTRLLKLAEMTGWRTMYGTEVLVRVAVAQQALWLEEEPKPDAVQKTLSSMQRVVSRL